MTECGDENLLSHCYLNENIVSYVYGRVIELRYKTRLLITSMIIKSRHVEKKHALKYLFLCLIKYRKEFLPDYCKSTKTLSHYNI